MYVRTTVKSRMNRIIESIKYVFQIFQSRSVAFVKRVTRKLNFRVTRTRTNSNGFEFIGESSMLKYSTVSIISY